MILTAQQVHVLHRSFPAHAVDVQVNMGTQPGTILAAYFDEGRRLRRDMTIGRTGYVHYDYSPQYQRTADGSIRRVSA